VTRQVCKRFVVTGRVQGVFYRSSTRDTARRLGLSGWVRNCSDDGVELVACGAPSALDELEAWLWKGPSQARVERVQQEDVALQNVIGFEVRG
jgi:acylphosphatase